MLERMLAAHIEKVARRNFRGPRNGRTRSDSLTARRATGRRTTRKNSDNTTKPYAARDYDGDRETGQLQSRVRSRGFPVGIRGGHAAHGEMRCVSDERDLQQLRSPKQRWLAHRAS